ncbi:MAG: L,D-transpeptidase, partial [Candidatus Aminicenantes bacterium]|nr:L,D-transpeptidase [Candidatus Aminicenantes bacterium]
KQFYVAKKRGFLPPKVGIGDLIEIHGGGKDYMTDGCISLENEDMDEIFNIVDVGTPVIIVGAIDSTNTILTLLKEL